MEVREWSVPIRPGQRAADSDRQLHFIEVIGTQPGPSTAFVSGLFGDKPLGCLTLFDLARKLRDLPLCGTVILVPAANLPALEAGTRQSPDLLMLNRRFPGDPNGAVTDQLAYHLLKTLLERTDCIVDLHSGMPTTALWYTYDFGNLELSASFGLPVILGRFQEGQLSLAVQRAGAQSMLVEFGGGALGDPGPGVRGCLDVLRRRGQLSDPRQGPDTVPIIEDLRLYMPPVDGILCSAFSTEAVGKRVDPGILSWVVSPITGERIDQFELTDDDGILLLANINPLPIRAGYLSCMVGIPRREFRLDGP